MELINGVSFEEYASACGNLAQGMREDQILKILGLEKPVWDETLNQWNDRLGELMTQDMEYANRYGTLFANPSAGRFSGNTGQTTADLQTLLAIVPDHETYQKIFWHQSIAAKYGIDPVTVIESYHLDLGKWGTLNMHYMNKGINSLDHTSPNYQQEFEYQRNLMDHWEKYWEDHYKSSKADLTSDINF